MSVSEFELLGHDCPLGIYPSAVVPVGRWNGQLVAIYLQSDGPHLSILDEDSVFVRHSAGLNAKLKEFDYREHRLFAFAADNVISYHVRNESEFFEEVLSDPLFSARNPFLRLSIAKALRNPVMTKREIGVCIKHLATVAPNFVATWYTGQVESFRSSSESFWLSLPASWEELLVSTSGDMPIIDWSRQAAVIPEKVTEIKGLASSAGVVEGTARVLKLLEEIITLKEGEIMVCPSSNPAWAPVFTKIKAAVTDIGGLTSHVAIVSREYGLPAVTGTVIATSVIKTGDTIKVDGDRGIVTIVKRAR